MLWYNISLFLFHYGVLGFLWNILYTVLNLWNKALLRRQWFLRCSRLNLHFMVRRISLPYSQQFATGHTNLLYILPFCFIEFLLNILLRCKPGLANIPYSLGIREKNFLLMHLLSNVLRTFTPLIACLLFKHWRKAKYSFKTQHRYFSFSPPPNDSVSWDDMFSKRLIWRRFCKILKSI